MWLARLDTWWVININFSATINNHFFCTWLHVSVQHGCLGDDCLVEDDISHLWLIMRVYYTIANLN